MDFSYIYIHSVNLVKLADGKPVLVHVLEALRYITTNVHTRFFLHDPGDTQKNAGAKETSTDLWWLSQIREAESKAHDILSKREWGFVVESKASFNGELSEWHPLEKKGVVGMVDCHVSCLSSLILHNLTSCRSPFTPIRGTKLRSARWRLVGQMHHIWFAWRTWQRTEHYCQGKDTSLLFLPFSSGRNKIPPASSPEYRGCKTSQH